MLAEGTRAQAKRGEGFEVNRGLGQREEDHRKPTSTIVYISEKA
jgi:hypothetical protein